MPLSFADPLTPLDAAEGRDEPCRATHVGPYRGCGKPKLALGPALRILYSVCTLYAERCWGRRMSGMCLWVSIGAACGGAFVGGLLVLWFVRGDA
jgi:hypothetical protein